MAKEVPFKGRIVSTGIFKLPVKGKIKLGNLNLVGDQQADLVVHGGPDKAVYAYPWEHYEWWQERMTTHEFSFGEFGENLTTEGLLEDAICIGDEFRIGSAVLRVSQPRLPCYKLGIKFGRADVIKMFTQSTRCGIYFSVVKEGELESGDAIEYLRSDEHKINLQEVAKVFSGNYEPDQEFIKRALESNLADQMKMFLAAEIDGVDQL
jgi:MOSC domain-containing protein YiiM